MAAISISPLPHTLSTMSSKRVPLTSNPNAVNSPYRAVAAAASKQKRSYATIQREEAYGQPPPAKKQMLENYQTIRTPPRQQINQNSVEGRVFTRKSNASQQSAFERKLVAVREKPQQTVTKADKTAEENLDTIRQWQKHYRKIFRTFVFYFESISEEVRIKYTKQVVALGAVSSSPVYLLWLDNAKTGCSARKSSSRMQLHMLSQLDLFPLHSKVIPQRHPSRPQRTTPKTASRKRLTHLF